MSTPSRRLRSSTSPRLLRFTARNEAETPGISSSPPPRVLSPPGGSILMTSAPMSARSIAQNGPAMTWVWSRTRMPSRAVTGATPSPAGESTLEPRAGVGSEGDRAVRAPRAPPPGLPPLLVRPARLAGRHVDAGGRAGVARAPAARPPAPAAPRAAGRARSGHVAVPAPLCGCANVLDTPTRQSFVVELVGREDLV